MPSPVSTRCSHCQAKLKLKSSTAIGKKVKCPKCQKPFVVKPLPESTPAADDDFLSDIDEFGDMELPARPRRKSASRTSSAKSKGATGNKTGLIIAGGVVGLLLIAGLAVFAWGVISSGFEQGESHEGGLSRDTDDPAAIAAIERLGGEVLQRDGVLLVTRLQNNGKIPDEGMEHLEGLPGLKNLVIMGPFVQITDAGLVHLKGLNNLEGLTIGGAAVGNLFDALEDGEEPEWGLNLPQVTDSGLMHLKGLTNLKRLEIHGTAITSEGLVHLKGLAKLENLTINRNITDSGLEHLKGLTNLRMLSLAGDKNKITDAGLEHLQGLTKLKYLYLPKNGEVTEDGIKKLQTILPKCKIKEL